MTHCRMSSKLKGLQTRYLVDTWPPAFARGSYLNLNDIYSAGTYVAYIC